MPKKTSKPSTENAEDIEGLKAQLSETQAKQQEYLDALLRERADFTNFRRRMESEKSQTWSQASAETFKKILPVLDDLERAMANRPAENGWADGIEMIMRKFQSILEKEGITRIAAEGQPFDPNLHEAIMQEDAPDHESGTVTAVLQQGYMHRDQVLRPAMVKVAA